MKQIRVALCVLGVLAGCEKASNIAPLQEQATVVAKYNQPALVGLERRIQAITTRRKAVKMDLVGVAGVSDASHFLSDAGQRFVAVREIIGPGPNGLSKLETDAAELAKAADIAGLEQRLDQANEEIEENLRVAGDEMNAVESWFSTVEKMPSGAPGGSPTPEPTASPSP